MLQTVACEANLQQLCGLSHENFHFHLDFNTSRPEHLKDNAGYTSIITNQNPINPRQNQQWIDASHKYCVYPKPRKSSSSAL